VIKRLKGIHTLNGLKKIYQEKRTDYFSSSRVEILELLPGFSERVLEIGCGSGRTLEMLKKERRCGETVGVDFYKPVSVEAVTRMDRFFCLDVEKDPLPENIGRFDLILLLDVLEHLVDPWTLLEYLKEEHLASGGRMIVSLPNARHFSFVLPLLFGRLNYRERGILDRGHLRFFTRNSAMKMLHCAGLEIEAVKPTALDRHLKSGKLNVLTMELFSGFLASQYIFRVSPRRETADP
jgi:SAM-dependent methyltransferase